MSDAEHEFALRLDTRVDDIGERLARIEEKQNTKARKDFRQHFAEVGGLLALCLSLITASYTLYNNFVVQPRQKLEERELTLARELVQREIDLRNDVTTLADLAARVAALDWANNATAANSQAGLFMPQRNALRNRIIQAEAEMPDFLGFADFMLLTSEFEYVGLLPDALNLIDKAFDRAGHPADRGSAYGYKARLQGRHNQLSEMRSSFTNALGQFKEAGMNFTAYALLQVYGTWVNMELSFGNCVGAMAVHADMVADFNHPAVPDVTRTVIRNEFSQMLTQMPAGPCNHLALTLP